MAIYRYTAIIASVLLVAVVLKADGLPARRIQFAKCDYAEEATAKPKSVWMTCVNKRGVCDVRAGSTHNLRAVFKPTFNSTEVDSYLVWNSWVEVALPGQIRDVCGNQLECPVIADKITRFTYRLDLQDFWPRNEYPVMWRLTDKSSGTEIACWKFRINII